MIRAVVDATRAHAGRESYEDDFTLVVVKRMALPEPTRSTRRASAT
jgi:hypothetical protein